MKKEKASKCETCNLRCAVKYPKKKVPYSEANCPIFKDGNRPERAMDRMKMLQRFNKICVDRGLKPIEWM